MLTFYITDDECWRAQDRAVELDVGKSHPPGQSPFLWDNRQGAVIRWYDYGSAENKLGAVSFEHVTSHADESGQSRELVKCTTGLSFRPAGALERINITDPNEHWRLFTLFRDELLGDAQGPAQTATSARKNQLE